MESTLSKAETMKPLLLKAGVPLVLSMAGFLCARIISRRGVNMVSTNNSSSLENEASLVETSGSLDDEIAREEFNNHDLVSTSSPVEDDEDHMTISPHFLNFIESSFFLCKLRFEEEILGLRNRIEELQSRESDLEKQFICYHALKEQESVLNEMKNMLLLETVQVQFLDREISSMEAEKQRFEKLVLVFLSVLEQLELVKMENGLLHRKVRKFFRKTRDMSRVIREKNLKIESAESEISECRMELESRSNFVKKLEAGVAELQATVNQLQQQKNQLMIKLNSPENLVPVISQTETGVTMEPYKQLLNEQEKLQKDRTAETAEVIYLRWTNACLRHELMRSHVDQQHLHEEKRNHLELELEGNDLTGNYGLEQEKPGSSLAHITEPYLCEGTSSHHQACSRKKKFLHKLKKWVEGNENVKKKLDDKENQENKCFGRHSVSEEAGEEAFVDARRSCSSA